MQGCPGSGKLRRFEDEAVFTVEQAGMSRRSRISIVHWNFESMTIDRWLTAVRPIG